ncbi:MAG: hypothetical protein JWN95_2531 [Frankiales bacterium]|nr:hypothetical protein [Frankiales bacterium]
MSMSTMEHVNRGDVGGDATLVGLMVVMALVVA